MKNDPIVDEVHRVREKMWNDCGGDLDRLIESLRASEKMHPQRVVSREQLEQIRKKSVVTTKGCRQGLVV